MDTGWCQVVTSGRGRPGGQLALVPWHHHHLGPAVTILIHRGGGDLELGGNYGFLTLLVKKLPVDGYQASNSGGAPYTFQIRRPNMRVKHPYRGP